MHSVEREEETSRLHLVKKTAGQSSFLRRPRRVAGRDAIQQGGSSPVMAMTSVSMKSNPIYVGYYRVFDVCVWLKHRILVSTFRPLSKDLRVTVKKTRDTT